MKRFWGVLLAGLLLVACTPSQVSFPVGAAEEHAAIATPTVLPVATRPQHSTVTPFPTRTPEPTAIDLGNIDLEPILIQSGDLPAGFSGAQIRDEAPQMFRGMPSARNTAYQQFSYQDEVAGGVSVFLYGTSEVVDRAYAKVLDDFIEPVDLPGLGDRAAFEIIDFLPGYSTVDLLFAHCAAVVHIRMGNSEDNVEVLAYAKRLNRRLEPLVCP